MYKQGQAISQLKVWKGAENKVAATVAEDLYITLAKGDYAKVKAVMASKQPLLAPIKKGQVVGSIKFSLDGKVIDERPLVAANDIEAAGFLGRAWDSIKLLIQ